MDPISLPAPKGLTETLAPPPGRCWSASPQGHSGPAGFLFADVWATSSLFAARYSLVTTKRTLQFFSSSWHEIIPAPHFFPGGSLYQVHIIRTPPTSGYRTAGCAPAPLCGVRHRSGDPLLSVICPSVLCLCGALGNLSVRERRPCPSVPQPKAKTESTDK